MSVLPHELKQSAENASTVPLFDWETCFPQFLEIFQVAVASKSNSLILAGLDVGIGPEEIPCILAFLNANPTIMSLDISNNFISAEVFSVFMQGNTTIKTLDISDNGIFDGEIIDEMLIERGNAFEVLGHNKILESLNLSDNGITDKGAEILERNMTLKHLNLSNNDKVRAKGAIALSRNTTLESLDFTNNHFMGYPGANALLQVKQNRIKAWKDQKLALLMGMHPKYGAKTSVNNFSTNCLFERKSLLEVFECMKPASFKLIHSFSQDMVNTILSKSSSENSCLSSSSPSLECTNAKNAAYSENKETKEHAELTLLGLKEQGTFMGAIAESIREFNEASLPASHSEVSPVIPVIFSPSTSSDALLSPSNTEVSSEVVSTARIAQIVQVPTVETPAEKSQDKCCL